MRLKNSLSFVVGVNVLALGMLTATASAGAYSNDFSSAVTLSPTQAPGAWYTDRFAPAGFQSSGGVLVHSIAGAQQQTDGFYNTQGRKYDVNLGGAFSASVEVFIPSSYGNDPVVAANRRTAGLWGTALNSSNVISAYPTVIFRNSDVSPAGFYTWNGAQLNSTTATVNYDAWNTLEYKLVPGTGIDYYVNGAIVGSLATTSTASLTNIMLQGSNYGSDYTIQWDNVSAVPEPASLGALALAGIALMRRRRNSAV